MNLTMIARLAKVVALFGFVLPWVLVSCSNQPLAQLSGLDMATGSVSIRNPITGAVQHPGQHLDLFALSSLALVAAGIVLGWLLRGRAAALAMAATSVGALALSGVGVAQISSKARDALLHARSESDEGQLSGLIQVHIEYGYWITAVALVVCIAVCAAVLAGRDEVMSRWLRAPPPA